MGETLLVPGRPCPRHGLRYAGWHIAPGSRRVSAIQLRCGAAAL